MSNATTTAPATAGPTPTRGFADVPCIKCREAGSLTMTIDNVTEFTCTACDESFTDDDVREHLEGMQRWTRVLSWIDQAPAL